MYGFVIFQTPILIIVVYFAAYNYRAGNYKQYEQRKINFYDYELDAV